MAYHRVDHYREENFLRLLNRMLFRAAKPEKRYGLPTGLVERFYRNRLSKKDKLRILIGKPPVPVHKALYNFRESAFIKRASHRPNRDCGRRWFWRHCAGDTFTGNGVSNDFIG